MACSLDMEAGNTINGSALTVQNSGLATVYAGSQVADFFHTAAK